MDYQTVLALALPVTLGFVGVGCAMALGRVVSSAMEATGRQPEASMKILISMVVGCAFIEALTIYALVVVFNFLGKV